MGGKLDILVLRCHRLFKEGKFELARAKYEKVMKVLRKFNHVNPQDDDEGMEFAKTRNLLHLNVAACQLKLGECGKCIETCNKVRLVTSKCGSHLIMREKKTFWQ
ncbi:peptidyl-prolyl cis-trans isomerase PASTICCINO1-like isoform X1 [Juglans regia]|uniref:Peptidyl-prolyl cis-trans isomerase PASTICCINO1-like isoform X1 n=1 Tax=Juglans regia TaxID=51240 RepID=A0A6P9EB02_JUGRE|nr:peptidyl-prolyl cis-trans isomerase PASTICCINO1-like isoform X1 [Juglans regia]